MNLLNNKDYYVVDKTLILKENIPISVISNFIINYSINSIKLTNLRNDFYRNKFNRIPECVKKLELNHRYIGNIQSISNHITELVLNGYQGHIQSLPERLEKLIIINHDQSFLLSGLLPTSLTYIEGIYNFKTYLPNLKLLCIKDNTILPRLSTNLEYLDIGDNYTFELILPLKLKTLVIGNSFNHSLQLPPNLENLEFKETSSYNLPLNLPIKLKVLYLNNYYNQPLNLPSNLEYLSLGKYFNNEIKNLSCKVFVNWSRQFI